MLKKRMLFLCLVIFATLVTSVWAAGGFVVQKSVLSGNVTAEGLVAPGTAVREGDILVKVETLTGALPAARATGDGVVKEVLVKPGDAIQIDQIVARIEMKRK